MSIFKNKPEIVNKIFKYIVYILSRYSNPIRRKQMLINCLKTNGYTTSQTEEETDTSSNTDSNSDNEIIPFEEDQFQASYSDRSRTSSSPFNRTFIQTKDQRIIALQQRAKESEETDYDKVKEILSIALNQIIRKYPDLHFDDILQFAMNMYLTIKKAYNNLSDELGGDIKRGTMVYILYYSLLENKINISPEELLVYFNQQWNVGILPKAQHNMFVIFGEKISFKLENFLCNIDIDLKTKQEINRIIDIFKENRIFSEPPTISQVAGVIYFVTNLSGPGKTYHELKESCRVSPDTIRKVVRIIQQHINLIS